MSRSQRVIRNVASLLLTQAVSWGLGFLINLFLPRYLGIDVLGQIGFAGTFGNYASLLIIFGTESIIVRDVAEDHNRAGDYVVAIFGMRLFLSILIGFALALLIFLLHYPPQINLFVIIFYLLMVTFALSGSASDVLRGLERIPRTNLAFGVGSALNALITLICIRAGVSAVPLIALSSCGFLATLLINLSSFRGMLPRPGRRHIELAKRVLITSLPLVASGAFVQVYQNSYPLIIHAVSGDKAVGAYSLVFRLFGSAMFIPAIITGAMLPAITRLRIERPEALPGVVQRMIGLILLGAIPVAGAMIFLSGVFVDFQYGAEYRAAVPIFQLFGFGLLLWYLSIGVGTMMVALGKQNEFGKISAVAAIVAVPLGFVCVQMTERYFHNGAVGASLAQILIECYILVRLVAVLPPGMLLFRIIRSLVFRTLLAAVPLLLVFCFLNKSVYLLLALPAGALYMVLCYLLRCITRQDIEMLRGVIARKTGRSA